MGVEVAVALVLAAEHLSCEEADAGVIGGHQQLVVLAREVLQTSHPSAVLMSVRVEDVDSRTWVEAIPGSPEAGSLGGALSNFPGFIVKKCTRPRFVPATAQDPSELKAAAVTNSPKSSEHTSSESGMHQSLNFSSKLALIKYLSLRGWNASAVTKSG
eukprot:CAMPEP_0196571136 /NCGR_PEP_ID=MMETSP1081-20130531/1301_1 /TAXON_ID=36882 /ORGANISM="Pyramimonas amylifera, Strain CCMP720" /LENGTH=157 /DNA_ID=CAMNT_0041887939 /DNA_START=629 /DNA_END=1103 /DNA_ORIENTATION=+